jgi:hypothetical protein
MPTVRNLHRRLVAWMAIGVLLFATLAPSVTLALRSDTGSWVEICTAMGMKMVRAADADPGDSTAPGSMLASTEHCPWCSLHAPVLGLPSTPPALLPTVDRADFRPWAFRHAPYTLHAWYQAQPRAPPSLV